MRAAMIGHSGTNSPSVAPVWAVSAIVCCAAAGAATAALFATMENINTTAQQTNIVKKEHTGWTVHGSGLLLLIMEGFAAKFRRLIPQLAWQLACVRKCLTIT
jgi:hypothetical protein